MSVLLRKMLAPYMAPADDGADLGGADEGLAPHGDDDEDLSAADRGDVVEGAENEGEDDEGKDKTPEPSEAKDDKAEDKGEKGKKDARIPLSRHKDIVEKERAKRQELERLLSKEREGRQYAALNEDLTEMEDGILALEKQYNALLSDGEVEKATAIMTQIRRAERQLTESHGNAKIQAAVAQATEVARYEIAIERIEEAYPELNEDHEDFDEGVYAKVGKWKSYYQSQDGLAPTAALQAAVKEIMGTASRRQKDAVEVTPRPNLAAERKGAAVGKTIAAARRTPPSTGDMGVDSDRMGGGITAKEVMRMSQEDFNKLDEKTLARMRGDTL